MPKKGSRKRPESFLPDDLGALREGRLFLYLGGGGSLGECLGKQPVPSPEALSSVLNAISLTVLNSFSVQSICSATLRSSPIASIKVM